VEYTVCLKTKYTNETHQTLTKGGGRKRNGDIVKGELIHKCGITTMKLPYYYKCIPTQNII
jgi:hypothetical protein